MLLLREYQFFLKNSYIYKASTSRGRKQPRRVKRQPIERDIEADMDEQRKEFLFALGYAPKAIDVLERELHLGVLDNATTQTRHQAGCGDVLELWLRIEDDVIQDAAFQYAGCAGLQASASGMTDLIIGMPVGEAERLDVVDIIGFLGAIPQNKYECAEASRDTLRNAIAQYRSQSAVS
jgi:nitrogen fixation protein NifU and related proteins